VHPTKIFFSPPRIRAFSADAGAGSAPGVPTDPASAFNAAPPAPLRWNARCGGEKLSLGAGLVLSPQPPFLRGKGEHPGFVGNSKPTWRGSHSGLSGGATNVVGNAMPPWERADVSGSEQFTRCSLGEGGREEGRNSES